MSLLQTKLDSRKDGRNPVDENARVSDSEASRGASGVPHEVADSFSNISGARSLSASTSFLHNGCTVRGAFECDGDLVAEGYVEGDVVVRGRLTIGETASVKANIRAKNVSVFGQLRGDIVCEDLVELQNGAQVVGNIKAQRIVIQDGVVFDGNCSMSDMSQEAISEVNDRD